ncbi:MAG TPA: histidine phosphatase family protein [Acidimicrobiales bacterium]|nr:histidine phosphatase family protein [Acidimicrobiales bacterium]
MTRLLLVRHAQSEWNALGRWQGWSDPPLSSLGREQARAAVPALGGFDAVVASDLVRARDTAAILADALGLGPVAIDPRLRERDVGEWAGLTREQIDERWPGALDQPGGPRPPGGESPPQVFARARRALDELAVTYGEAELLVVTHGGVIRGVERHFDIEPAPLPNLGGVWLDVEHGRWELETRVLLVGPNDVPVTVPRQL